MDLNPVFMSCIECGIWVIEDGVTPITALRHMVGRESQRHNATGKKERKREKKEAGGGGRDDWSLGSVED